MPKTRISEYSTTNSDNTDIESININEGCAPSGINNAIRELMVHLKEWQSGAADTYNTPAGTVSAPAIAPTGDSNTGIFFPAADTIAFAEGGVEVMRINSSGNVLVKNNAADNNYFQVQGSVGELTLYPPRTGADYGRVSTDVGAGLVFETNGALERMRIDSSGNVGIGSSSITAIGTGVPTLELKGTSASFVARSGGISLITQDGTTNKSYIYADTDLYIQNTTATNTRFYTNNIERMRITSAGEVLVGGTTAITTDRPAMTLAAASGPYINLYRDDTTVSAGNGLGTIGFYGNDTTSNTPTLLAYVQGVASGTHAAGDNPTDLVFGTTPDGSETVAEAMRLTQAKNLKIGGTASRATTEGTNQVVLFNGTAPVGTLTNGVSFYSAAGEARVMDAAGNSTLLSPHDQSTNEWIFHSKHTPSGKVLRIDVERLLKFVNDHFGLDAVHEFIE